MQHSKIKRFLQLVALMHVMGGLLLPQLVNTRFFAPYTTLLDQSLILRTNSEIDIVHFLIGLFGPTIASWGILFLYVVTTSFRHPDSRGWWAMFLCCVVWAPYDSLLSIQRGIWIHAAINLVPTLAILIPLLVVRKSFFQAKIQEQHD